MSKACRNVGTKRIFAAGLMVVIRATEMMPKNAKASKAIIINKTIVSMVLPRWDFSKVGLVCGSGGGGTAAD